MPDQNKRDYFNRRLSELTNERQSFIPHWQDIADFNKPRKGRFFISDRNKGDKRYQNIINNTATNALKIAVAGLRSGTTPQTRPWFSLETHDPDLMESENVKEWLHKVELTLYAILSDSNFYQMVSTKFQELMLFGTSAMTHVDDFNNVARFYTHTAGSYMIDTNDRYEPDTLVREFEWTASKIVQKFGKENVSTAVKNAVDRNNLSSWHKVVHFIEPNEDYRLSSPLAKNKPYLSVYYEPGNQGADRDKYLSVSGFDEFPAYITRWEVTGEDIYGTDCPGMTALGDVKHLQQEERDKAKAIQKMVTPPMGGPASLRNVPINSLPGGATLYDSTNQQELKPLYTVNPQLNDLRGDLAAVEQRINKAFYVDMFLAITNIEGIQPRNQLDLIQRNEERLLQLGPVLERMQHDFLDKVIDRTFNQAVRAGILPDPPEELQEKALKVRYISTLMMAQRAISTQNLDRLSAFAGNLVGMGWTDALKKVDASQMVDEYAQAIGVMPKIIVPDEIVQQQIQAERQQQQQMQQLEMMQSGANTAKLAADSKTDEQNLLTDVAQ